jgi:hypothetical protein
MCASAFCWRTACQRRGGNPPAPAFPRGNGKGGDQTSLLPQAVRAGVVRMPGTRLVYCVLALLPRFSPLRSPTYMSIRSIRFPEVLLAHPLICRASIRTLHGPHWARCKLGSDLKPRSITTVTDLGCLGAAIWRAISKGSKLPNAVTRTRRWISLLTKTSRGLLAFASSTHVGYTPHLVPDCGCFEFEWLCLGGLLLDLGRLRCFRCRRAMA